MSEMVDRIATVIETEDDRISRFTAERLAVAIIDAMREPSKKMAHTINQLGIPGNYYRDIIDAAL